MGRLQQLGLQSHWQDGGVTSGTSLGPQYRLCGSQTQAQVAGSTFWLVGQVKVGSQPQEQEAVSHCWPVGQPPQPALQAQLQLCRSASKVGPQLSAAALQTHLHWVLSKTKPAPQVCAWHLHAHTAGAVSQRKLPVQVPPQAGGQMQEQLDMSHTSGLEQVPPQFPSQMQVLVTGSQILPEGHGPPQGGEPPSGSGVRSIQYLYETEMRLPSWPTLGRQAP